ncbi:MAG TPA: hypothetical protein VGI75_05520 [Pirellulales bacterium]
MATNNRLLKQLHRELTANPKKTVALGLLLLVAIWFWMPLVMKWMGNSDPAKDSAIAVTAAPVAAAPANVALVGGASAGESESGIGQTSTPTASWHQLLHRIHSDPLMRPHMPNTGDRDPFTTEKSRLAQAKKAQPVIPAAPELTPSGAGLALSSTVIGPKTKTALINGRAYHENQLVTAANGQDRFLLVEIRSDAIVLSRHGDRFDLKLKKMEFAKSDDE